ncbi:MAG: type IV pilin protein [Burkholderiaceae bacterium]|jgi:prepilin-type N-terminal cleavage/methylation domain-containing protein
MTFTARALLSRQRGFTLIEMIVAMSIAAILAALAYSSYASFIRKTHLSTLKEDIAQISALLERSYALNSNFPAALPAGAAAHSDYFAYTYRPAASAPGAPNSAYTLTGKGKDANHYPDMWVGTNGAGLRCFCDKCTAPTTSFTATLNSCPTGTTGW